MGLHFFSANDLKSYLERGFAFTDQMNTFNTSADFFAEFGFLMKENLQIGIDYTYNIYSFNSNSISGSYDIYIDNHKPSLMVYYVIPGKGYAFKFGGGIGLRTAFVEEQLMGLGTKYSTSGFGILLKAQGDTKLGGNFYALISGEIRYDAPGEITTVNNGYINFTTFGVTLKLGTIYYF